MFSTSTCHAATAGTSSLADLFAIRDGIMARNRSLFGGFTMKDGDGDGGQGGAAGSGEPDGTGGSGSGDKGSGAGGGDGKDGDGKDDDEPLGPGGKKALQAERDGRKQLEQQIQQMQQAQKDQMAALAAAFGLETDKKTSTDDLVSTLQQQVAEMNHNAAVDRVARANDISNNDDIELLRSAKDSEQMEKLAARLKGSGQQQQSGTPRPDRSAGRGGGDDKGATSTVSSGRDLFRDRHKKS